MRVDIVVHDGLDEMDALGPLEVLRSAAALGARLVTQVEQPHVHGTYGLTFTPDRWARTASSTTVPSSPAAG